VERVLVRSNGGGGLDLELLSRSNRLPGIGDKYTSRHGQKGVVGVIACAQDVPFSRQGIVPDIVMNPHGFPSRMTAGKILELVGAKSSCLSGEKMEGLPFRHFLALADSEGNVSSCLSSGGFEYCGKDFLTGGSSGGCLGNFVFSGIIYYQRLKHMSADKCRSRSTGSVVSLSRQPSEGRSREGGLRLGEMERDCVSGYGCGYLLHERMLINSDHSYAYICCVCGSYSI
jgi:DNA-directed RNA polymerase III subunit RPC2